MKIQIIKSNDINLHCWYNGRIGEVFEVSYIRNFDNCYMVIDKSKSNWEGVLSYVNKDDCIVIKD
jgi:hypothetical protein